MVTSDITARACPNCAADKAEALPAYLQDEWQVVECMCCAMVYLQDPAAS
jgi:hypothetical protein